MNANPEPSPAPGRLARLWQRLVLPASPASAPASEAPRGSVGATIAVAAVPSAASLVWTAWSLVDMIPAPLPVGLAAGVVLDIALVSAVAIAWINPSVAKPAKTVGWLIAGIAAVLVGYHAFLIMPILAGLGVVPLVSKGLWHLALNARLARAAAEAAREAEEAEAKRLAEAESEKRRLAEEEEQARREAELSTEPTHEEQRLVAQKRRQAAHERELAEAEADLADAQAERDHQLKLAKIRRDAAQTREMDREDAEVVKQRVALAREIQAGRGLALGSGDMPNDLSELSASPGASLMGFGSAMGSDLRSPRGASPSPAGRDGLRPELLDLLAYIADAGPAASVRGASRELGCDPATIRRRRDLLAEAGHDVSAITRKK